MKIIIRPLACALFLLVLIGTTSCGKPRFVSDNAYEQGKTAIGIAEDYLNGIISSDVASAKLDLIPDRIPDDPENISDSLVRIEIMSLSAKIRSVTASWHSTSTSDVKEELGKLKKTLNLK